MFFSTAIRDAVQLWFCPWREIKKHTCMAWLSSLKVKFSVRQGTRIIKLWISFFVSFYRDVLQRGRSGQSVFCKKLRIFHFGRPLAKMIGIILIGHCSTIFLQMVKILPLANRTNLWACPVEELEAVSGSHVWIVHLGSVLQRGRSTIFLQMTRIWPLAKRTNLWACPGGELEAWQYLALIFRLST